jgi:hypothetical protein
MDKKKNSNPTDAMSYKKMVNNTEVFNEKDYDSYPDISNVVSSCECTGMMYSPPQNESEFESYQELFNMGLPKDKDIDVF